MSIEELVKRIKKRDELLLATLEELKKEKVSPDDVAHAEFFSEKEKKWLMDKYIEYLDDSLDDNFLDEARARIEARKDPIDTQNKLLTWGTEELDKVISPIEPHYFIVLTGESGSGKTAYTFDMAIKNSKIGKVLYISLEMGSSEIITRIARNYAVITKEQWRDKSKISEGQKNRYKTKRAELLSLGQLETIGLRDASVENICKTILSHEPVLAIVDNLDLIDKEARAEQLDHEARVSKQLMQFTNKNKIPLILVHHLKKGKEGKERIRGMNAVKGSSKIVHDADSVIMCHRTLSKTEDLSPEQKAQFTVVELKDRSFGIGGVKTVYFNRGTFDDEFRGSKQPGF